MFNKLDSAKVMYKIFAFYGHSYKGNASDIANNISTQNITFNFGPLERISSNVRDGES